VTDAVAPRLVSSTHEPVAAVSPGIRRYVRVLLENWGLHAKIIEDALVVVSKFVASVVDHAHTRFALVIQFSSQVLRIAVHDESDADPVLQPVDPYAERGRGLQLVARLSPTVGLRPLRRRKDRMGRPRHMIIPRIGWASAEPFGAAIGGEVAELDLLVSAHDVGQPCDVEGRRQLGDGAFVLDDRLAFDLRTWAAPNGSTRVPRTRRHRHEQPEHRPKPSSSG
jgi:hypothetical protein